MANEIKKLSGRLITIDFLRGIASLGVVIHHAFGSPIWLLPAAMTGSTIINQLLLLIPAFGFSGVYLFFVISGFCIHLRWVKAQVGGDTKPLEFIPFWKRRIRRLYPAYLVALILYIAFEAYWGKLQFTSFFFYDLISHILMLHNLDSRTVYSFNKVFWTLAVEEQLYLAYFLLVWLRKKYGWLVTLAITLLVRAAWFGAAYVAIKAFGLAVPITEYAFATWCVWALGAVSIEAAYGLIKLPKIFSSPFAGAGVLLITAILCAIGWAAPSGIAGKTILFVTQPLFGVGFFIMVNYVVSLESKIKNWYGAIVRFFAWIGLFSYSLYLTHELLVTYIKIDPFILIAICVIFAWVYYLCFEKPFMNKNRVQSVSGLAAPG
jgi:peptidoglycan/LPS O-acetylase OafA/YrhL